MSAEVVGVQPKMTTRNAMSSTISSNSSSSESPMTYQQFRKLFETTYRQWSQGKEVKPDIFIKLQSFQLTVEQFDQITLKKNEQRYIAIIDGRIRFDELPVAEHGVLIGRLNKILSRHLDGPNGEEILSMTQDNDVLLSNNSKKRPDSSYTLPKQQLPAPPPPWLKLQPDGRPFPNLVVEVAVNHESPQKLLADMERYFSNVTSIRIWIGIKYWPASKKIWIGWAERNVNGIGGNLHTQMNFPPNLHSITQPINIVYQIPIPAIFGPNINPPSGLPPILLIDTDAIRSTLLSHEP